MITARVWPNAGRHVRESRGRLGQVDADRVADAFAAVPREWFLPERERGRAAYDGPIAIGHGQTNSQPRTVEAMLRLLAVRRGDRVLDVGAGSGVEHRAARPPDRTGAARCWAWSSSPSWWRSAATNLHRGDWPWARIEPGRRRGRSATAAGAPYDRILVSAEADELPTELVAQLGEQARMVVPVAGEMLLVERGAGSRMSVGTAATGSCPCAEPADQVPAYAARA